MFLAPGVHRPFEVLKGLRQGSGSERVIGRDERHARANQACMAAGAERRVSRVLVVTAVGVYTAERLALACAGAFVGSGIPAP